MAAVVHQKDKRSGITYAYESVSYWDKEKKQSRARRTLIGRVDEQTGEIIRTDGRGHKKEEPSKVLKPGPVPSLEVSRRFYGATYPLIPYGRSLACRAISNIAFLKLTNRHYQSHTI